MGEEHLVVSSAGALQKTGKPLEGYPGGCQSLGGSMSLGRRYSLTSGTLMELTPPKTPGRLGNSVPKAGSVCPGTWHLGLRGGSPRQQTNWAKDPWAAPEGGKQREQRAQSSFPLPLRLGMVGGVGSLA